MFLAAAGILLLACTIILVAGPDIRSLASERTAPSPSSPGIAVFCYHDISDALDAPSLTFSPVLLRAQIRGMKQGGWAFLSLSELLAHKERPAELPPPGCSPDVR